MKSKAQTGKAWAIRMLKLLTVLVSALLVYEIVHLVFLPDITGWGILAWMEEPSAEGPSALAAPEDRGSFEQFLSYDGVTSSPTLDASILGSLGLFVVLLWFYLRPVQRANERRLKARKVLAYAMGVSLTVFLALVSAALSGKGARQREFSDESWEKIRDRLQVGDVLAYRMEKWSARREIFLRGDLTFVGYRLFKYGHLAIVVADPLDPGKKVLFTSQSFKGVNVDEDLDTLRTHNWDAYRLDRWERIDKQRFSQYVDHCRNAAGHFTGYDFSGMFALWNANLKPKNREDIGAEYICSTAVVTILHYAGFESDAIQRDGWFDLVTPYQVVKAMGRFMPLPPEGVAPPESR